MQKYILAIDQGTTGTTSLLLDSDLKIRGKINVEFPQHFPKPSWVEHDLEEIWRSVCDSVSRTLEASQVRPEEIAAIGITNQRETTCLWERENGRPIGRAIVWQDRRTAGECEKLKKQGHESWIRRKTGLVIDPYFSATKLSWMLKNISGVSVRAKQGKLAFGTIESFLLYRMTSEHATDVTNASRTLLMDLRACEWDPELLKLFRIPPTLLPRILASAQVYGKTRRFLNIPDGTPVTGLVGDQQAALFGQACFKKGTAKCTYGTGAFVLANIGEKPVLSKNRLLTTVAWKLNDKVTYGFEGSAFIAGAVVQWLRDGLGMFARSGDVEDLAASVPDSDGVILVPALSGMGAPHWLPTATGLITGLTRRTTKAHLARAALDGIAYQVSELVEAMAHDSGRKMDELKADGGAAANKLLMQFQSDLLNIPIVCSEILETTALGAGLHAGLGIGLFSDLDEIAKRWKAAATFKPQLNVRERKRHLERWSRAMGAVQVLASAAKPSRRR